MTNSGDSRPAPGSDLALSLAPRVTTFERALLVAPRSDEAIGEEIHLTDQGVGADAADLDRVAAICMEACLEAEVKTVVVEDDVARLGDPSLNDDQVTYVEDHVVRWLERCRSRGSASLQLAWRSALALAFRGCLAGRHASNGRT